MPIGGLGAMRSQPRGGLGRRLRRRYADGGELGPDGLPIPTPENLWNGAGAPEPGMIGYEQALPLTTQAVYGLNPAGGVVMTSTGAPSDDPARFALGPPYTPSTADAPAGPPLDPPIFTGGEGGAAPAGALDFSAGTGAPANWQDFQSKDTTTGGGFWTMDQLFGGRGEPVPDAFQSGAGMASTNNYHLLPPGFQTPDYIMRNGTIIDMNDPTMYGPLGRPAMGWNPPTWRSGGPGGYPVAYAAGPTATSMGGWPGQQSPWAILGTAGG